MIFTDTHTHLYSEAFDLDRDAVIKKAINAGVERFFIPAIDSTYTQAMLDLKIAFPENVYLMCGLHPTHVKENVQEELNHVLQMLEKHNYVAIGEIGVDLFWDKTFKQQQLDAFHKQIQWSLEQELPIAIHCRDAFDEVFEVLEDYRNTTLSGIFHCFTGNLQQAKQAVELNLYLGIGGVATFKNGKIDQFLNEIPLSKVVLETDSPYLAPVPYRGKRNESSYLTIIAEKLAEIYKTDLNTIATVTTQNSVDIFGL